MFTKTTQYAIRALVYIYLQNLNLNRPGFREIAKHIGAPEEFTGKIVQHLVKSHIISSIKGRGGGFFFTDMHPSLNLLDVIKIIEGDGFFNNCGFGLSLCSKDNPCPIHTDYAPVREKFRKITMESTIEMLALKIKNHKAVLNRNQY